MNIQQTRPLQRRPLEPLDPMALHDVLSRAEQPPVDADTAASLERIRDRLDEESNREPIVTEPNLVAEIRAKVLSLTYGELVEEFGAGLGAHSPQGQEHTAEEMAAWLHRWAKDGLRQ